MGYTQFVASEAPKFINKIDRRQTAKQVINGFTGLLYACYYGHLDIVKILLEAEYDVCQNTQVMVPTGKRQYYVFDRLVNAYHAAVLSRSANAPKIIDYITEVAQRDNKVAT